MKAVDPSLKHVLDKFKRKGFNHLTLEELAITQTAQSWPQEFKSAIGEDWDQYQEKADERLRRANFNIKWLTRQNNSAFAPLFSAILRGDLKKFDEFIRISDLNVCVDAVDETKKTCLHLAAREGHFEIAKSLVAKGWAIDARDKLLTTPLHQASSSGHSSIVQLLLSRRADINAKDNLGRTALLFAVSSPNPQSVVTLLTSDARIIDGKDYTGRSALHYAIFNPHPKQVEIIRKLLEFGIPADIPDSDNKTPLHHACEAGKTRSIRILLKWGANIEAKDSSGKTPVDIAINQNIKQLVLLYGQSQEIDSRNEQKLSEDKLPNIKKQLTEKKKFEPPLGVSENRDKLISFLKKIQEAGINTNQHSLKPQMYSGLWLNDVSSAGALHREIAKLTPSEAVLQIFNVLFPYPKSLPPPVPDTSDFQSFFGLSESNIPDFADFRPEPTLKIQDDSKLLKLQQLLQVSDSKVFDLQQAIVSKDQRIQALQIIIEEKTEEMASAQKIIQETREKFQDMSKLIPNQDEIKKIKAEKENLLRQLDQANTKYIEKEQEYNVSKAQIEELKNDVKSMPSKSEVEELKIHIEKLKADDRALRFIAGQVLIKGIDNKETKDPASAETHLQDNEILIRLETSLKNNRPSLKQRLIDVDANKDDKVSKAEVTKVLSNLALVPQDIVAFLRIAGFRAGVSAVPITDIINLLSNRENNMQNLENQLFGKLSDHFKKGALNIEQAFQFLDLNGDGKINFQELSDTLDTINLPLSREDRHALFAVLDSDHNGSISLEEFKQRIETAKPLPPKPAILPKREETKIENSKGLVKNELKEPVEETPVKLSEKKIVKKISGSLVIGIVKGKALGQGNLAAQLTLKGSERVLKTPFLPGPDPDWKFKSTVKLFDTSTAQVDTEIYLELLGDRGLIASCKVPWLPTLDFPNSWAVKTDFPLLEPNNRKHGSVIVHLMWVPKEALRVEGGGNLTLQLLSFSGFGSSHIQLAVNTQNVMGLMKQAEQLTVKNIYLKPDEPIPSLKFTIFTADTRQMVLWKNLSMELAIANQTQWTDALNVPLEDNYDLKIKMKWTPMSPEAEAEEAAATKIQAVFRGNKAREELAPKQNQIRKIIARKIMKGNNRYYMVTVYDQESNYKIELNPADDPELPMFETLHTLNVAKGEIDEIFKNLQILTGNKLSYSKDAIKEEGKSNDKKQVARSTTRGGLMIEIVNSTNVKSAYISCQYSEIYAHSTAGPPWSRKIVLQDIEISGKVLPLDLKLFALETRTEIASGSVDWSHAVTLPDTWTPSTQVSLGNSKLEVKFLFTPYKSKSVDKPPEVKLDASEEGLQTKTLRKCLAKRGIKKSSNYYLICVYESKSGKEMELHSVGGNRPMYEPVDKAILEKTADIDEIIKNMEISANNKMIFQR